MEIRDTVAFAMLLQGEKLGIRTATWTTVPFSYVSGWQWARHLNGDLAYINILCFWRARRSKRKSRTQCLFVLLDGSELKISTETEIWSTVVFVVSLRGGKLIWTETWNHCDVTAWQWTRNHNGNLKHSNILDLTEGERVRHCKGDSWSSFRWVSARKN